MRAAAPLAAPIVALAVVASPSAIARVEVLKATGGLPAHVVGMFRDAAGFQQASSGRYFVFDRRAHAVYGFDPGAAAAVKIVEIGHEEGRIIEPTAFDLEPGGTFVVADAPNRRERIQTFTPGGSRMNGFSLPVRAAARIRMGDLVLSGIGSLQFTGRSLLMSLPETGALVTEYSLAGTPFRTFGNLRPTGQENDDDLHLALNSGIPLVDPKNNVYFVFHAGEPLFRKYDAAGKLLFERHIEGREVDQLVATMPNRWPKRSGGSELPLVPPVVRTASVDPAGNLWVALAIPFTYVYDADGDKVRVVQFQGGAGLLTPSSLSFSRSGRLLVVPGCYEFDVRPKL